MYIFFYVTNKDEMLTYILHDHDHRKPTAWNFAIPVTNTAHKMRHMMK